MLPENIFNLNKTDYENPEIILGERDGIFDTVNKKYPEIWQLYKSQKNMDWDENEFDYSVCNIQFKTCDRHIYDMMIKNLAWQWEADTVASKIFVSVLSNVCTSAEAWAGWQRISDNECLTPDHEVLTPNGWKFIKDVTLDDEVAQWNYETWGIDFVKPEQKIEKFYKGPMFHFHNAVNTISQIVTPNHRMPTIYPYWNGKSGECKEANVVNYHGGNGIPTAGVLCLGRKMTPQERLYVAVQADGSLCSDKYTGQNTGFLHYRFSFKKERKIQRLHWLCDQAGWEVRKISDERESIDGLQTFYVYVPVDEYNWQAKTFDWFKLDDISFEWGNDFVEELQYWDGNTVSDREIGIRYISGNKSCIDKAMAVGHLIGMRSHLTTLAARTDVLMPTGNYSDTKETYQLYFSKYPYLTGNSFTKNEIEYEGMVYCLTVPTSYFVVRHNNAVSITGNCVHAATYSEIVRNSFDDPTDILDEILRVQEAHSRLVTVGKIFHEAKIASMQYGLDMIPNDQELYNKIYKFIVAILCMERIQFMASFAVTFGICESTGLFQPAGKGIQKIAQDEFEIHVQYGKAVLKELYKTERGKIAYNQCKQEIITMVEEVVNSEVKWTDYAFSEGRELTGVTCEMMKDWVYFSGTDVLKFFGLEAEASFPVVQENPLKYMENWLAMDKVQASNQEEDTAQYKVNVLARDDEGEVFDF